MELIDAIPRWVLEVGFVVYVVSVALVVLLERRRPTATLALLLALVFVPLIGLLVYWVFSRNRVQRRRRRRRRREIDPVDGTRNIANLESLPEGIDVAERGLIRLALQTSAAPLRRADVAELLPSARSAFDALCSAIESAQSAVCLEFYIWRDDVTSRKVVELLAERARAGVEVRVLYDHLGSLGLETKHFAPLLEAGGRAAAFSKLRIPLRMGRSRLNLRNHRKIVVVDGRVGFVGGMNMGDEYFGDSARELGWRDLFMRLDGDAVVGLEATFLDDWLATTGEVVELGGRAREEAQGIDGREPASPRIWQLGHPGLDALRAANPFAPLPERPARSSGPLVQIIPSGPDLQVASVIAAQFSAAIGTAVERVRIATPYFIPDEPLMLLLRTAALRGVDVRILVPRPDKNDSRLVAVASRSYYDDLLEAGCRIFEYQPGMFHAKYLIVDGVAALGSANMDVRSFHLNYEVTAMFYDAAVTRDLDAVFEADLAVAREVSAAERLNLSLGTRLMEGLARLLSPLL